MFPFSLGSLTHDDPSLAVAINLVSIAALFAVGLCALWISLARYFNWRLRGLLVLLGLAPLVVIPAYDLFVAFWMQALVAAALTVPLRSRLRLRSEATTEPTTSFRYESTRVTRRWWPRYSLADLFACFAFVAVAFGAASQIKFQWTAEWVDMLIYAPAAGVITAASAYCGLAWRRGWLLLPLLMAISWCIGWCLLRNYAIRGGQDFPDIWLFHPHWREAFDLKATLCWFAFILTSWLALFRYAFGYRIDRLRGAEVEQSRRLDSPLVERRRHAARRLATFVVAAISVALLVPLALLYVRMLNPLDIPPATIEHNPYTILKAAGKSIDFASNEQFDSATIDDARAFVARNAKALALAHELARSESEVDAEYYSAEWSQYNITPEFDTLAHALEFEGHLFKAEQKHERAVRTFLDIMWLAQIALRRGDLSHCIGSTGIEENGRNLLLAMRTDWAPDECRAVIRQLNELDQGRAATNGILACTRLHWEHGGNWKWRLHSIFVSLPFYNFYEDEGTWPYLHLMASAKTRLLMADLAIQAYEDEHHALPERLEDLVPEYLPAVPLDPFAPRQLTYFRDGAEYMLYSVGYDKFDNGGVSLDFAITANMEEWDVLLASDLPLARQYEPGFVLPGAEGDAVDHKPTQSKASVPGK